MNERVRIEVDAATAEALAALAAERGVSVAELVAELVAFDEQALPEDLEAMRAAGEGPWSSKILAEDEQRWAEYLRTGESYDHEDVSAWLKTWGTANYQPFDDFRKTSRRS